MPTRANLTSGVDKSCAIRPPRCATGPKVVTHRAYAEFDRSQVETGVYHINYNMVECMEGSDKRVAHPFMREEPSSSGRGEDSGTTTSRGMMTPKPPALEVGGSKQPMRRKKEVQPLHHRHKLASSTSAADATSFGAVPHNVTDHDQIPFSVKTQLEVWLAAFKEETLHHKSQSICFETILQRVREVSEGQEQPTLFSLVTAMILLTKFVPRLGSYGELMQGTIAEIGSAVYLLPSKGVGFTVALDAYAKKTFFDAFREVKLLYDMHQSRAKRYRCLLRLEASVLQGSIDRWAWQAMNVAFRGWRHCIHVRQRKTMQSRAFFVRWQRRQFVPQAVGRWHRYTRVKMLLAREQRSTEDASWQLQILYAQEQAYRVQRVTAEAEFERLTQLQKRLETTGLQLHEKNTRAAYKVEVMRSLHRKVAWTWATVMQHMFGDVHELVVSSKNQLHLLQVLDNGAASGAVVDGPASKTATPSSTALPKQQPHAPPTEKGDEKRSAAHQRRASVNISDNAAALRRRVHTRNNRLSTNTIVAFVCRFAPNLRDVIPKTSSREDAADFALHLVRRVLGPTVGASALPVRAADLVNADQVPLQLLMQLLFGVFLGGHCSLFLNEAALGAAPVKGSDALRTNSSVAFDVGGPRGGTTSPARCTSPQPAAGQTRATTLSPPPPTEVPPPMYFQHRCRFESRVVTGPPRDISENTVEAALMVQDTNHGMELLLPLEDVHRTTMQQLADGAQQGEARQVHQAAQSIMGLFALFHNQRPPGDIIHCAVRSFVRPRDWRRICAAFPMPSSAATPPPVATSSNNDHSDAPKAEGVIANSMDLLEYTQEVSLVSGYPMKLVLEWLSAGIELDPMARLFVAAASDDVAAVAGQQKETIKLLMRQSSAVVDVRRRTLSEADDQNGSTNAMSASQLGRSAHRRAAGGGGGRKFVVKRDHFVGCFFPLLEGSTTITKQALEDVFDQTLFLRTGASATADLGSGAEPWSDYEFTAVIDDDAFVVLLLFVAHFHNPDPYLESAVRLGRFLEWAALSACQAAAANSA